MKTKSIFYILSILSLIGCKENVVDLAPSNPVVKIISPQNNAVVSDGVEIIIQATDDKRVIRVELMINHQFYGYIDTLANVYKFYWSTQNLMDGSQHLITAIAYDQEGNKSESNAIVNVYRFTPFLYQASIMNDSTIELKWVDNSKIETGFEIERAIDDTNFVKVLTVDSNIITANVYSKLEINKNYYFRMRAFNRIAYSKYSPTVTASLKLHPPTILNPIIIADTLLTLSWNDNNSFEEGYNVYINNTAFPFPANTTNAQVRYNFIVGQTYSIHARAFGYGKFSVESNKLWTILNFAAPTNLKLDNEFTDKVHLKWNDNSSFEKGYAIYKSINNSQPIEIGRTAPNAIEFIDNNLNTNEYYKYSVRAFTDINNSLFSDEIEVSYTYGLSILSTQNFALGFDYAAFSSNHNYLFKNKANTVAMYDGITLNHIRDFVVPPDTQYGAYPEIVSSYSGNLVARPFDISFSGSGSGSRAVVWNSSDGSIKKYFSTSCVPEVVGFSQDESNVLVRECSSFKLRSLSSGVSQTSGFIYGSTMSYYVNSPTNHFYVSVGNYIKIYELSTGSVVSTINTPTYEKLIGISEDGIYLISFANNSEVIVRDLRTATKIFSTIIYQISSGTVTADGNTLLLKSNNDIILFDLPSQKKTSTISLGTYIYQFNYLWDSDQIAIATRYELRYYRLIKAWRKIG
jgi:hypothetical protein